MNSKALILCSNSTIAQIYAKALGISKKNSGYAEGDKWIITWCDVRVGRLSYPEAYKEEYKKWSLDYLPFFPQEYKYELTPEGATQFHVLCSLLGAVSNNQADSDSSSVEKEKEQGFSIDAIYYAVNPTREGLYAQMLVRQLLEPKPEVEERVIWTNSLTDDDINRGIADAKPVEDYANLTNAGFESAIESYATGINFTRILTLKYGQLINQATGKHDIFPVAVGRVMTSALGLVVEKERERAAHKVNLNYKIESTININGKKIIGKWSTEKTVSAEDAKEYIASLPSTVEIKNIEKITEKINAPTLYNLAELQYECEAKLNIRPDETLKTALSLYEKKMITYPITDARVLSVDVAKAINRSLIGLEKLGGSYKDICEYIIEYRWNERILKGNRFVDNVKANGCCAIIPTGKGCNNIGSMSALEKSMYAMIIKRFLSIFYPPASSETVHITMDAGKEMFYAEASMLMDAGYMAIAGKPDGFDEDMVTQLLMLKKGDIYEASYFITKEETAPPKRYTFATMVLAMEGAGQFKEDAEARSEIKSCGIGTAHSRFETVNKLIDINYLSIDKKTNELMPTSLGNMVYEAVLLNIPTMLNPKMAANWEMGLEQVSKGQIDVATYRSKLQSYINKTSMEMIEADILSEIEEKIKPFSIQKEQKTSTIEGKVLDALCPLCGGKIKRIPFGYVCSNYGKQNGQCAFAIGEIANVMLTEEQVTALVTQGKTGIINDFLSVKDSKFSAALKLEKGTRNDFKIEFDIPKRTFPALRDTMCPICKKAVLITDFGYSCENYLLHGKGCKFGISRIAGKQLSAQEATALINFGKTDIIKGFISKSGKQFDAALKMDENGKIAFDFREPLTDEESNITCARCGKNLLKDSWTYYCDCGYRVPFVVAEKILDQEEVLMLIKGRTRKIDGFKSKTGKFFSARLVMDINGKVTFDFKE